MFLYFLNSTFLRVVFIVYRFRMNHEPQADTETDQNDYLPLRYCFNARNDFYAKLEVIEVTLHLVYSV